MKTLVLSHLEPGDDDSITDEMWARDVRKHYNGRIIVGKDLIAHGAGFRLFGIVTSRVRAAVAAIMPRRRSNGRALGIRKTETRHGAGSDQSFLLYQLPSRL